MIRFSPIANDQVFTLTQLAQDIFLKAFLPTSPEHNVRAYVQQNLTHEQFARDLTNSDYNTQGVFLGHQLIGYIQLVVNHKEFYQGSKLELKRFYLSFDHHGQGYAEEMMKHSFLLAQKMGFTKLWLGVWEHNYRALKFYYKMGFERISQHEFVMGDEAQTDYILLKNLTDSKS